MRRSHASRGLAREAELTTVRDNLRLASIATMSGYLHGDEVGCEADELSIFCTEIGTTRKNDRFKRAVFNDLRPGRWKV